MSPALAGRSVQVVNDISSEEQLYLYERARRLKQARRPQHSLEEGPPLCEIKDADCSERINEPDATVYLLFMEGSTRTKESFRNAAAYQGVKVNVFQAETSSFQKNETMCDTIKMLTVYSLKRTVFVIRSPLEGVCRWLETALPRHALRYGVPRPSFLNAGDGKFTHPLAEYADIFSILELSKWRRDSVHLALVGDLSHGRTAHSKVDGLRIFKDVRVDLIAPEEFAYPVEYYHRMLEYGFQVRRFESVEAYLDATANSGSIAKMWYFCRPQMSKLGDLSESRLEELWTSVSFKAAWHNVLPEGAKFLQTLPRDKVRPQVPLSFDTLPVNAWDSVSSNSYYLNIVLLGALHGAIGEGLPEVDEKPDDEEDAEMEMCFPLDSEAAQAKLPDYIENIELKGRPTERRPARANSGGSTVPLRNGLVIDHIGLGLDPSEVWKRLRAVRGMLGWSRYLGSEGIYCSSSKQSGHFKGIMHFPDMDFVTISAMQLKVLASIAPESTVNAIASSSVVRKLRLHMPLRIHNLPNTSCKNELCVSHPNNKQRDVVPSFERVKFYETSALPGVDSNHAEEFLFVCKYCRWPHQYKDIWKLTN